LGDLSVRSLTADTVQTYLRNLPIQRSSAHAYGRPIKAAFRWAVRRKMLTENPLEYLQLPRFERAERRVMDDELMRTFLGASRGSRFYPTYCLALGCGLCIGEVLGLEWRDVDTVMSRVTVRQGKTRARRRVVVMPEFVRQALLGLSPRVHDEPVIPRSALRTVQNQIYKDLKAYTNLTFHELRHSHATALLVAGEPLKVVSERLGHSSVRITADVYQHVLPGLDQRAASKMDELLRPVSKTLRKSFAEGL
jgi:integrase